MSTIEELKRKEYHWLWGLRPTKTEEHKLWDEAISIMNDPIRLQLIIQQQNKRLLSSRFRWVDSILSGFYRMFINPIYRLFNIGNFAKNEAVLEIIRVVKEDNDKKQTPNVARVPNSLEANSDSPIISSPRAVQDLTSRSSQKASPSSIDFEPPASPKEAKNDDTILPSSNLETGTSPSHPQDASGVKSHSSQQGHSPELVREKEPSIGGSEDANEPDDNSSSPKESISRADDDTIPPSSNLEPGTSPSHPQDGSGVKSHSSQQGYSPELVREKEPSIGGPEDTNEPEVNSSSPKESISRAEDTILPSSNLETGTSPSHPQDGSGVKSYSSQQGYSPELVREKEPSVGGPEDTSEPDVNLSSPKKSISRADDTILPSSNLETGTSPSQPQDGSGVKSYSSQQGHSPELVLEKEPSIGGSEDANEPDVNSSSPKESISRAEDTILPSSNLETGTSPSQPQDGSGVKSYSSQQGYSPELVREKEPSVGGPEDTSEPDVNLSSPKKSISRADDTILPSSNLETGTSPSQPQDGSGVKSYSSQQGHSPELVLEKEPSIGGSEDANEPDVNSSSPKKSISRADDTILPSSNLETGTSPSQPQDGSGVKSYSSQQGHSPELVLEKEPSIGGSEDANEPDVNSSSPKKSISRADDTILPSSNLETGTSPSHPQDGSGVKSYSSQQGYSPELVREKEPSIGGPEDTNEPDVNSSSPKESISRAEDTILPSSNLETGTSPSHPQDGSGVKSYSSQQGYSPELVREKEPSVGGPEDTSEPDVNLSSPKKSISRADDTILPSSNLETGTSPSQPQDGSGVKSYSSQQGHSPELVLEKEPSIGGSEDANEPDVNSSSPKKSISRAEDTILPSSNLETGTSPSQPQDASGVKSHSSQQGYSPELVREKEPSIGSSEHFNEPDVNSSSPKESISRADDTIPRSPTLEMRTSFSQPQDASGVKSHSSQQGHSPELVLEKEPSIGEPKDTNEPVTPSRTPTPRADYDTVLRSPNIERGISPSNPRDARSVKSQSSQRRHSPVFVRENEPSIGRSKVFNEPEVNLSSPKKPTPEVAEMGTTPRPHLPKMNLALSASSKNPFEQALEMFEYTQGEFIMLTSNELTRKYRKLTPRYHPDKAKNSDRTSFQRFSDAYNLLDTRLRGLHPAPALNTNHADWQEQQERVDKVNAENEKLMKDPIWEQPVDHSKVDDEVARTEELHRKAMAALARKKQKKKSAPDNQPTDSVSPLDTHHVAPSL
jgi:hypothetical protein